MLTVATEFGPVPVTIPKETNRARHGRKCLRLHWFIGSYFFLQHFVPLDSTFITPAGNSALITAVL